MVILPLINAIESLFATDTVLVALFPGMGGVAANLWQDIAPENSRMPYAVYSIASSDAVPIYSGMNTYVMSTAIIKFTVYALGKAAAQQVAETMVARMDAVPPTPIGAILTNMLRKTDPVPAYEGKSVTVGDVWRSDVTYSYSPDATT